MQRTACILTQERYLLFRRATRRYEKPCYASFLPSMPTERSRFLTTAAQDYLCKGLHVDLTRGR